MSDEVDDVCWGEVSGVVVSPAVENVISAVDDKVNIAIVVGPVVVLGVWTK